METTTIFTVISTYLNREIYAMMFKAFSTREEAEQYIQEHQDEEEGDFEIIEEVI